MVSLILFLKPLCVCNSKPGKKNGAGTNFMLDNQFLTHILVVAFTHAFEAIANLLLN